MKQVFALTAVALFACGALAQNAPPAKKPATPTPPAAGGDDLNLEDMMKRLYEEAAAAFNQSKYDVALQQIGVIHTKTNNKPYANVMFLEGACLYNLEQYDKSAEVLANFVKAFPDSEQVADAKMAEGRALLKVKDNKDKNEEGVKVLRELAGNTKLLANHPEMKVQAGVDIANFLKKNDRIDEALGILESITADGPTSQDAIRAIVMKAEIFLAKRETEKAQAALEELRKGSAADESVVQINEISRKIALDMMESKSWREALVTLQNVRRKSEILRIQKARVARINEWIATKKPVQFMGRTLTQEDLANMKTANEAILGEIEKAKDYDASVYYLLGQCFYEMKRYYESFIAFQRIYTEFPDYPDRSRALFGMIMNTAALNQYGRSMKYCEKYMAEFPEGVNNGAVTELYGNLVYQSGDIEGAIRALRKAKEVKGADKERMDYMLGSLLFDSHRFEDSRMEFQALIKDYKNTIFKDDAQYRIALTWFFENKSIEAKKAFQDYITNNPKGQYLIDAKYRIAFIAYQAGKVSDALDVLEQLVRDSPNDPNAGQVYALLGDIYNSKQDATDKAEEAYRNGFQRAQTEDVITYCLENLTGLLTAANKWSEVKNVWSSFYTTHKTKPEALKAIYWISKAGQREELELEAKHQYTEAKSKRVEVEKLIADAILPQLGNPADEQVEVLIGQLVSVMTPSRRAQRAYIKFQAEAKAKAKAAAADPKADPPKPADAKADSPKAGDAPKTVEAATPTDAKGATPAAATADATPVVEEPQPPATFDESEEQMKKLLTVEGDQGTTNGTAAARVLYARALLAQAYHDVTKFENLISIIPDAAKTEELSPLLLGTLAKMLMKKGDMDKAGDYFARLRSEFPKSEFADMAPVGLGDIQYAKGTYSDALKLYDEAINKSDGSSSMLDATLGKAKCLLKLNRLDQAETVLKKFVQVKEWKSEAGQGFYWLGQVGEAGKKWDSAINYYMRVILAHQRDKVWLARSYLQAAKCYLQPDYHAPTTDKDGKPLAEIPEPRKEAARVLQEMLRKNGLQEQPEYKEAQDLLSKITN